MESSAGRKITIRGIPVFSGSILSADHPIWGQLRTAADFAQFAKRLRGQFCIIVDHSSETVAITDFGCSRPIFYQWDAAKDSYRISPQLQNLIATSNRSLSKAAQFFYATRRGIGIEPFYSDIKELFPATVTHFRGAQVDSTSYLNWGESLESRPIPAQIAEGRFIDIASDYLGTIFRGVSKVGCLLSGGTDSALMAWILRSLGKDVVCFTADYHWGRYSEFAEASSHATTLGLRHERVLIDFRSQCEAFRGLNGEVQNAPCCHSQSPSLLVLAKAARREGLNTVVTGDHADALFLGFDRYFRGFPQTSKEYAAKIARLTPDQKLDYLYSRPALTPGQEEFLSVLGCSGKECMEWQEMLYTKDREFMAGWAGATPLPTLQQLDGQIWAGIGWQNIFLPATQALEEPVEFVSPFYDIEMIRFALSLPMEYKFENGTTKVLLRRLLQRAVKRDLPKRASPNPSRIWGLLPRFKDRWRIDSKLRPLYDRTYARNLLSLGGSSRELDHIAALGLWLSSQNRRIKNLEVRDGV